MKFIYKLTLIVFLIPLVSFANDNAKKHEKTRTIKKDFSVNADAIVRLNNRYGNLNIMTWDQNRVEIEVKITVKGNDLEQVEKKLSSIDVVFNSSDNFVEAETVFEKYKSSWGWWGKGNNVHYQINYNVKMPITNNVDLDNDYGNIYLDDLKGSADINCDYGKISIGDLMGVNNDINLDYCSSSTIAYLKSGDINIDYSKLTVEKATKVKLNADYSTAVFRTLETLDFNTDYGSVRVDDGIHISGNGDYTSMRFGTVRKNLDLDTDYGSIRVKDLSKGFERVNITSQYAGIKIGTSSTNNFNFEIDLQYASFKRDDDNVELYKSIVKSTKKYYEGVFGKGSSSSKITIKSQYGSVSLQNNY